MIETFPKSGLLPIKVNALIFSKELRVIDEIVNTKLIYFIDTIFDIRQNFEL